MKLTVFGASGGTGSSFAEQALAAGHDVTAVVRDPARLTIAFHHLYLGAMLRWLADPGLKLRKEFAAAVDLFLHGAAVPAKASSETVRKPKKRRT